MSPAKLTLIPATNADARMVSRVEVRFAPFPAAMDRVTVWNAGGVAGDLNVLPGHGEKIARRLLGDTEAIEARDL